MESSDMNIENIPQTTVYTTILSGTLFQTVL